MRETSMLRSVLPAALAALALSAAPSPAATVQERLGHPASARGRGGRPGGRAR